MTHTKSCHLKEIELILLRLDHSCTHIREYFAEGCSDPCVKWQQLSAIAVIVAQCVNEAFPCCFAVVGAEIDRQLITQISADTLRKLSQEGVQCSLDFGATKRFCVLCWVISSFYSSVCKEAAGLCARLCSG